MEIAVSYKRAVNHALYGGGDYENSVHFCSFSEELPDNASPEAQNEAYTRLKAQCRELVAQAVIDEVSEMTDSLTKEEAEQLSAALRGFDSIDIERYEELWAKTTPNEKVLFNELRREAKRTGRWKDKAEGNAPPKPTKVIKELNN